MKAQIIIKENIAHLVIDAETEFEKRMIGEVEAHQEHTIRFKTDRIYGNKVTAGSLTVTFSTK